MNDSNSTQPSRRLGRGLSALLGGNGPAFTESSAEQSADLRQISVAQLTPNPFQPRQVFDAEALGELASSIREHGVLQPILVREVDGAFQVIAGERRWKAAQKAGLTSIPCRIVDVVDKTACEFALEENLKRKDLSDLEKAQAFKDYLAQFECSIEELGKQLSMNRSTISNMLRLLDLPGPVKNALNANKISAGHARALLPLPEADQLEMCGRIQAEQLSVRAVEATVKKMLGRETSAPVETAEVAATNSADSTPEQQPVMTVGETSESAAVQQEQPVAATVVSSTPVVKKTAEESGPATESGVVETIPMSEAEPHRTHHIDSLETQLRDLLGVPVEIQLNSKESGKILVPFTSNSEFERILNLLRRHAA
ncbi:ParB/RepB/Spo0J family partition protein [Planctomicrobium sp. SH527]|uniref:ParB/RepB/Spo0J family partition protein n=1 Tax=Planctomicrobium sp. SH527 TaxID=3448123 RepID=UPI003F5C3363